VCSCPHVTKPSTLTPTSPSKNFFTAPTCSGLRVGVRVGVGAGVEARSRVGVGVWGWFGMTPGRRPAPC
jgi:hypothetical protein